MKICLVAEGSYPYIIGGVSNWIHMLIQAMPEHEFIIYTIGAYEKDRGNFKFKIPDNVETIYETFLDSFLSEQGVWGKRYKISGSAKEAVTAMLAGRNVTWADMFDFFHSSNFDNPSNFLMSKDFFDILTSVNKVKYSQTPFIDLFWTIRSMILPLLCILKQEIPPADIYHSVSTGYAGIIGSLGKHLFNRPFLLTEHGIYAREREEEIIKSDWMKVHFKDSWIEYFLLMSKCAYEHADTVVTLFNRNKEIQVELGCDENKICIVPNGIRVENYVTLPQKDIDDNCLNIGAIVRVVPIKDIKTMLNSFSIVKEQIPKTRFFIMGPTDENPEYFEECKQLVVSLQLEDVVFTGNVDLREYLGKMDILVLSSISEGQPFAVLEGMACSKPSVSTDVGSCRELIYGINDNYGQAGLVVPVMSIEKLAAAIVSLCQDPKLRSTMGFNARDRISSLYTIEKFIDSYKKIYSDLREKTWLVSALN